METDKQIANSIILLRKLRNGMNYVF